MFFKKFTALASILILSMVLATACAQKPADTNAPAQSGTSDVAEIKTMTGSKLVEQNSAKKKDEVLLIDVRSPEEYQAATLKML